MPRSNRRRVLELIGAAAGGAGVFTTTGVASSDEHDRSATDRDRSADGPSDPFEPDDGGSLELAWEYDRRGTPVVSGETLFLSAEDDSVRALDATDGTLLWDREAVGNVIGVSTETVFVGTDFGGESPRLSAHDTTDGSLEWSVDRYTREHLESRPAVDGDRLYVVVDGDITAFDATTGRYLWEADPGYQSAGRACDGDAFAGDCAYFPFTDVVAGGGLVVGVAGRRLFCYDETGEERWTRTVDPVDGTLQMGGRYVVCRGTSDLEIVDAETGERTYSAIRDFGPDVVDDTYAYTHSYYRVSALELETGTLAWSTDRLPIDMRLPSLAVADDTLLVAFGDVDGAYAGHDLAHWGGSLVAFDRETGHERWVISDFNPGEMIVHGDTLYTATGGYRFETDSGTENDGNGDSGTEDDGDENGETECAPIDTGE